MPNYKTLETSLVHAGAPDPRIEGAVSSPIFCSANFESKGETSYQDLGYLRLNKSPNHLELHKKLRAIERGEAALVTASGMAAISAGLMCQLQPGDHILVQEGLYGGTFTFLTEDLKKWGVQYDFVDGNDPSGWRNRLKKNTKLFYLEAISNPLTRVPALREAVNFCREHELVSMVDSTFATPVNFQPLTLGFDLVVHSATKYLNGHSDVLAGALVGSKELADRALHLQTHLGATLDPHACFLLNRGLKTLSLRVKQQNSNAAALAAALESYEGVERVYYPGLTSHPDHERARSLFRGYGGMLSFETNRDVDSVLRRLTIPIVAPSLGGVETLVTRPAHTSHAGMTPAERAKVGIADNLIRVSLGIEDPDELINDFLDALS